MTYMTMKIDPNGNLLWYKTYDNNGPNHSNRINGMAIDAYDNVYVTGACDDSATFATDIVTIKYNAQGDFIWLRKFDGPDSEYDNGEKILVDQTNHIYVGGTVFRTIPASSDWVLLKYDSAGTALWTRYYDYQPATRSYDAVTDMKLDISGNVLICGVISTTNAQATLRYGIAKFDSNGDSLWTRKWGGDGDKKPMELLVDGNGNSYVVGHYYDLGGTGYNGITLKYDVNGTLMWEEPYHDSTNLEELLFAGALDGNHDLLVAGRQHASLFFDFVTIKYHEQATALPPRSTPDGLHLACHPNPFSGSAEISYTLPQNARVSLRLVDGQGRSLPLEATDLQTAGTHRLRLDAASLQAGIYYLELLADAQRTKVKLVLTR